MQQAGGLQGARILRRRRYRHGAVLGPAGDRRRREDRVPARPRVGLADDRDVGPPARPPARQAAAVHRRLAVGRRGVGVGPGDRGAAAPAARRADRGAGRQDRADAAQSAADDEAARQPVAVLTGAARHPAARDRCSTAPPGTPRRATRSPPRPRARASGRRSASATNHSATSGRRLTRDDRGGPRTHPRAAAAFGAGADRGGRLRRRVGDRDRRADRRCRRDPVPALRLQGGAVRRGVQVGLRPRDAGDAGRRGGDARRRLARRPAGDGAVDVRRAGAAPATARLGADRRTGRPAGRRRAAGLPRALHRADRTGVAGRDRGGRAARAERRADRGGAGRRLRRGAGGAAVAAGGRPADAAGGAGGAAGRSPDARWGAG